MIPIDRIIKPKKIIPIGSLRDSMYRAVRGEIAVKQNQICLISQFKGLDGHGLTMPRERQMNLDRTAEFTNQYAIEHNLDVLIALYSDTPELLKKEKELSAADSATIEKIFKAIK